MWTLTFASLVPSHASIWASTQPVTGNLKDKRHQIILILFYLHGKGFLYYKFKYYHIIRCPTIQRFKCCWSPLNEHLRIRPVGGKVLLMSVCCPFMFAYEVDRVTWRREKVCGTCKDDSYVGNNGRLISMGLRDKEEAKGDGRLVYFGKESLYTGVSCNSFPLIKHLLCPQALCWECNFVC